MDIEIRVERYEGFSIYRRIERRTGKVLKVRTFFKVEIH